MVSSCIASATPNLWSTKLPIEYNPPLPQAVILMDIRVWTAFQCPSCEYDQFTRSPLLYYCISKGWCGVGRGKDRIAWETNFPSQWFTLCASELSSTIQEIIIIISVVCGSLGSSSLLLEAIRKSFMI